MAATWLSWVQRLHTISKAGLTYTTDPFDRERFEQVERLAAEILARHVDLSEGDALRIVGAEAGYPTPKVDVRAVVFCERRVLLTREAADGRWALPGGWADIGESAAEVAVRETREETGYHVRAVKLLAVLDKAKHPHPPQLWYTYKLYFRCELVGGAAASSHETLESGFFAQDALPPLSLERNVPSQLARLFEHLDRPDLPTDFD